MSQLENSNQADLTGFPPDLSAPIRPAVPRRTTNQLSLGTQSQLSSTSEPALDDLHASPRCASLRSPLSSSLGSPLIDVDDDLDELELDDADPDELGDDDHGLALFGDANATAGEHDRARSARASAHGQAVAGAATFGDRARRLGARFAHKVLVPVAAIAILVIAMGGTWTTAGATPTTFAATQPAARTGASAGTASARAATDEPEHATRSKAGHHELSGKLNLNTATEDQLMVLPSVGPAKAERIVTWRKKNGGFKRTADLRRVKGFGYKTFKKLEPYLDIKGDTTLAPK